MWPQLGPSPYPGLSLNSSAALSGGLGVHRASPTSWPWWRLPSSPFKRRHLRAGRWRGHPPHSLCNFQTSPPPFFNPLATLNIHQPAMPPMPLPVLAATTSQPLLHILGRAHCLPCAPASFSMTPASTHAPSAPHLLASRHHFLHSTGYPLPVTPWTLASQLTVPSPNFHPDHTSYPSSSLSPRQASSKTPPPRDSATFSPTITAPTPYFSLLPTLEFMVYQLDYSPATTLVLVPCSLCQPCLAEPHCG